MVGYVKNPRSVSKIVIESGTLSTDALTDCVNEIRENATEDTPVIDAKKDYTLAILITGGIVFVSAVISAIFISAYLVKRKRKQG